MGIEGGQSGRREMVWNGKRWQEIEGGGRKSNEEKSKAVEKLEGSLKTPRRSEKLEGGLRKLRGVWGYQRKSEDVERGLRESQERVLGRS